MPLQAERFEHARHFEETVHFALLLFCILRPTEEETGLLDIRSRFARRPSHSFAKGRVFRKRKPGHEVNRHLVQARQPVYSEWLYRDSIWFWTEGPVVTTAVAK